MKEIERLRADGTLQEMIETSGQDAVIDELILKFSDRESD